MMNFAGVFIKLYLGSIYIQYKFQITIIAKANPSNLPMLAHKQQQYCEAGPPQMGGNLDDACEFTTEQQEQSVCSVQNCRLLQPSLLNKSSIHSVNLTCCNLSDFPAVSPSTQKLDLSQNNILSIPQTINSLYIGLKELRISNNRLKQLPKSLGSIASLRILVANNNFINILDYFPNLRFIQLRDNPITKISKFISKMKLQGLDFDWIPFLVNVILQGSQQAIVYAFYDVIKATTLQPQNNNIQCLSFYQLFKNRKPTLQLPYLLHKAISRKSRFFISFLKNCYNQINYNAMIYNDRPLLQQLLSQKNDFSYFSNQTDNPLKRMNSIFSSMLQCDKIALENTNTNYRNFSQQALQLFKIRRSNLYEPEVFMVNLVLACRYAHYPFFQWVVGNGLKRDIIIKNVEEIIQTILRSFNEKYKSDQMLQKILYLSNYDNDNKKTFHLPRNYSLLEAENICDGILFIMNSQQLDQKFDFRQSVSDDVIQPLLHFAMINRKPQLVKTILQRFKNPFIKNYTGKLPKSIRGSIFSRKMIWKYEKISIKQQFQNNQKYFEQLNKQKERRVSLDSERWLSIVYKKQKKINLYSSPQQLKRTKNQAKQIYRNASLMGSQIQQVQKQCQRNFMLNKSKLSRLQAHLFKQASMMSLGNSRSFLLSQSQSQIDQTGILYDFVLNLGRNRNVPKLTTKLSPKMNILAQYQLLQRSGLETVERDYEITYRNYDQQKTNKHLFIKPWRMCTDAQQLSEQQFESNYENRKIKPAIKPKKVLEERKMGSNPPYRGQGGIFGDLCVSPCMEVQFDESNGEVEKFY